MCLPGSHLVFQPTFQFKIHSDREVDGIQTQLLLPRDQSALDGPLSFSKQDATHVDSKNHASLFSIITPSPAFEKVVNELLERQLVKKKGRDLSIHHAVQEAVNYYDLRDLQQSFNIASRLVYEQFPKMHTGSFNSQWNICQQYISHGVCLSKKFNDHASSEALKAASGGFKADVYFVSLLSNCAW